MQEMGFEVVDKCLVLVGCRFWDVEPPFSLSNIKVGGSGDAVNLMRIKMSFQDLLTIQGSRSFLFNTGIYTSWVMIISASPLFHLRYTGWNWLKQIITAR